MKKGFTLIELLIVIAIIGILAVAFLPSILGAPAKGRDVARLADLQKIQKVLVNGNLAGVAYPGVDNAAVCFDSVAATYISDLGGKAPQDPQGANAALLANGCGTAGGYTYKKNPNNGAVVTTGTYSFGLYALVEQKDKANTKCSTALAGTITPLAAADGATEWCYAILTK